MVLACWNFAKFFLSLEPSRRDAGYSFFVSLAFFREGPFLFGEEVYFLGGDLELFWGGLIFLSLVFGIRSLDPLSVTSIGVYRAGSGIGDGIRVRRFDYWLSLRDGSIKFPAIHIGPFEDPEFLLTFLFEFWLRLMGSLFDLKILGYDRSSSSFRALPKSEFRPDFLSLLDFFNELVAESFCSWRV